MLDIQNNNVQHLIDYIHNHPDDPNPKINTITGGRLLHTLIRHNKFQFIDDLLTSWENTYPQKKFPIDQKNYDKETPLHLAVMQNKYKAVDTLLHHGANPNVRNSLGESPLHTAVRNRSFEIVSRLLEDPQTDVTIQASETPPAIPTAGMEVEDVGLQVIAKSILDENIGRTPLQFAVDMAVAENTQNKEDPIAKIIDAIIQAGGGGQDIEVPLEEVSNATYQLLSSLIESPQETSQLLQDLYMHLIALQQCVQHGHTPT